MTVRAQASIKVVSEVKHQHGDTYQADQGGVIRFPALPNELLADLSSECLSDVVSRMWADPRVRDAIHLASNNLFTRIRDKGAHWISDRDLCLAVARYLLRMSFRPTPFGGFAGVGFIESGTTETSTVSIFFQKVSNELQNTLPFRYRQNSLFLP